MKRLRLLGLAIVAVCALGALSASVAGAYEWTVGSVHITEPREATGTSTTVFRFSDIPGVSEQGYQCSLTFKHTLKTEGRGEITSVTNGLGEKPIHCGQWIGGGLCESQTITINAVHLPWSTQLTTVGGALRDTIAADGAGEPEWELTCKLSTKETFKDLCGVSSAIAPYETYTGTEQLMLALSVTECSTGRLETQGGESLRSSAGAVGITPAPPASWDLNTEILQTSYPVKLEGKLKLTGNSVYVECPDTGEGTVGGFGAGQVTKMTFSSCTGSVTGDGACKVGTGTYITALNTPWNSELGRSGRSITDSMASSGAGTPGFKYSCRDGRYGINIEYSCTGAFGATVENNAPASSRLVFAGSEELSCSREKESGTAKIEGTQTIVPSGESRVEAN